MSGDLFLRQLVHISDFILKRNLGSEPKVFSGYTQIEEVEET